MLKCVFQSGEGRDCVGLDRSKLDIRSVYGQSLPDPDAAYCADSVFTA